MKLKPIPTLLLGTVLCTLLALHGTVNAMEAAPSSSSYSYSYSSDLPPLKMGFPVVTDEQRKHSAALFYSDIKLDDLVAIATLHRMNLYSRMVVVIEAVQDKALAEKVLRQFMDKVFPGNDGPRIAVFHGSTEPPGQNGHEEAWEGLDTRRYRSTPYEYSAKNLRSMLKKWDVDAFQIAPINDKDINTLIEARLPLWMFHVTHGFNTSDKNRTPEQQTGYLESISERLNSRPDWETLVIVTDRTSTRWLGDGSTMALTDIDTRLPSDHLLAALQDKFPLRQFQQVNEMLEKHFEGDKSNNLRPYPPNEEVDDTEAMKHISYARVNWQDGTQQAGRAQKIRTYYLDLSEDARKWVEWLKSVGFMPKRAEDQRKFQSLPMRFDMDKGGVPNTFRKVSMIELYDMVHAVAVKQAQAHHQLQPFTVQRVPGKLAELGDPQPDYHHGYKIDAEISQDAIKDRFMELWPGGRFAPVREAAERLFRA